MESWYSTRIRYQSCLVTLESSCISLCLQYRIVLCTEECSTAYCTQIFKGVDLMCSYPNKTKKKESCEDVGQNVLEEKTCAEALKSE